MARAKKRVRGERDYIRKRGNVWWIRFQYTEALRLSAMALYGVDEWPADHARSLHTTDELEARRRAQADISKHLDLLAFHAAYTSDEPMGSFEEVFEVQPETNEVKPDGTRIIATRKEIIVISPDNQMEARPNPRRFQVRYSPDAHDHPAIRRAAKAREDETRAMYKDVDSEMLEAYVAKLRGDDANLARSGLRRFKELNGGKPIADSARSDVKKLIQDEMVRRGPNGGARVKKMIRWLAAAVNHNIQDADQPLYTNNIFARHEIKAADLPRPPYTEADIKTIKENLHQFDDEQKLMIVWHISSSVRPVGLDSIRHDEWVQEDEYDDQTGALIATHRTRAVQIEHDKDDGYGYRKLPIPQAVLDLKREDGTSILPEKIIDRVFQTPRDQLLVEINRKLYDIGVNTDDVKDEQGVTQKKGKSLYSGRHRARDRFRQINCSDEMSRAIMGHARSKSDSHGAYGHGFTMYAMKAVIDRIRF